MNEHTIIHNHVRAFARLDALFGFGVDLDSPEYQEALTDYKNAVAEYEKMFPDAHVAESDPATYDTYSDLYKDEYGIRPVGFISGPDAREFNKRFEDKENG